MGTTKNNLARASHFNLKREDAPENCRIEIGSWSTKTVDYGDPKSNNPKIVEVVSDPPNAKTVFAPLKPFVCMETSVLNATADGVYNENGVNVSEKLPLYKNTMVAAGTTVDKDHDLHPCTTVLYRKKTTVIMLLNLCVPFVERSVEVVRKHRGDARVALNLEKVP